MTHLSENREIVDETKAITDVIRGQRLNLKKDAAKLPTKPVIYLEPLEILELSRGVAQRVNTGLAMHPQDTMRVELTWCVSNKKKNKAPSVSIVLLTWNHEARQERMHQCGW